MSETGKQVAVTLREGETFQVRFEGREEFVDISGNGHIKLDMVTHGRGEYLFGSTNMSEGWAKSQQFDAQRGFTLAEVEPDPKWQYQEYLHLLLQCQAAGHEVHKEIGQTLAALHKLIFPEGA